MKASVGDQLVVESPKEGTAPRDGEVVGLHHDDGSPPYDVRWSDTGRTTLVFPGPDAHVRHLSAAVGAAPLAGRPQPAGRAGKKG
ncbi:DUF1918 domain-containing protein [Streptomyces sp. TR06-5]|uniref:DUF1918 domain-containing protein n=1 Tax=unclassified Streptomyces TaxID=2593676 RepID=UPI0039A1E397